MPIERAVRVALVSNVLITVLKFGAAILSGSAAMFAEAYHSVSDSLNQVFLQRGLRMSKRKPDERHPFGYGKARYFWSLVVAMLLFGIAGAFSAVRGIERVLRPHSLDLKDTLWAFGVLFLGSILEGYSLIVSLKELRRRKESLHAKSLGDALKKSKDATLATVIIEDALAQVGVVLAAAGLGLTVWTGNGIYDGLSSLAIGLILMSFALVLARRNKELIIGEALDPQVQLEIIRALEQNPNVHRVVGLRTMHLSPNDVLLATEINFAQHLSIREIETAIDDIGDTIRRLEPRVQRLYVTPEDDRDHVHPSHTTPSARPRASRERGRHPRKPATLKSRT